MEERRTRECVMEKMKVKEVEKEVKGGETEIERRALG